MRSLFAAALLYCISAVAANVSAAVVIVSANTRSEVYNAFAGDVNSSSNTSGDNVIATIPGGYYSQTSTSATIPSNVSTISTSIINQRGGDANATAISNYFFEMTVDADVSFAARGDYSNTAGLTYFQNLLLDVTGGFNVYDIHGAFSESGVLLAGHTYIWYGGAYTQVTTPDSGATAIGSAALMIGAVPEQSSAIVWMVLAIAIGGTCWWKRRGLATI